MTTTAGRPSFEEYVVARWARLVRSVVLMGADTGAAEDLVQTVLARAHDRWARVSRAEDLDAYVHRMLINALIDSRRRRWWGERPGLVLDDGETAGPAGAAGIAGSDPTSAVDVRLSLTQALRRLPLAQRQVVVLRFWADLSERQTAEALGVAPGTVKSRTARALAALQLDPEIHDLRDGADS